MTDSNDIQQKVLSYKKQFENSDIETVLLFFLNQYRGKIALASSFGAEDQALTHLLWSLDHSIRVFTLDTGRLNQETYDVMQETRIKYNIPIEITFPDSQAVTEMVNKHGPNLFYESVEKRKMCCGVRKVQPLRKKLAELDVWITGLRREQSVTRSDIAVIEYDETHDMIKLNPLAEWTNDQVWAYISANEVPYNKLHDLGYPSIGCACCTRAVLSGQDIRAGRWWWEEPETKECGLHIKDGKLVRKKGQ
ncbi:MAG: phosphoadenylyl-sulfate reductase [Candidatus Auribacterota bacterium]